MTQVGNSQKFDLDERTAVFAEKIIDFTKTLPKDIRFSSIITQLIRSATSVGANYCEADDAHSRKDFFHKISICKKESRETKYWLRMIAKTFPNFADDSRALWREAQELNLIFAAIAKRKE